MAKKDLKKMSRGELIEIIYAMQNDEEGKADKEIPSLEQITEERKEISYKKRYRKILRSTIGTLMVVAAAAAG